MAYQVNKSDGTSIIVQDTTINTETSLKLLGKNFSGYGEYIAENNVHLLENFANISAPVNPVAGQLWYKKDEEIYYYFNGVIWNQIKLDTIASITVLDTGGIEHVVTAMYDEGAIISITSNQSFNVNQSDPVYIRFSYIGTGITLAAGSKMHGTATTAEYADLAEKYLSDKDYEAGTVLKLGGSAEVTQTNSLGCRDVFGIVSSDPAYLMNSGIDGIPVALTGRVPCKVTGRVRKGERLIASGIPGVAIAESAVTWPNSGSVEWTQQVGRSLENKDTDEVGLIEVVIGAR